MSKKNPPESVPGPPPIGPPSGWLRWKIMCGRCGKDAGFVLAGDLFRDKGKPTEPRQNQIKEPSYFTWGEGSNVRAVCVTCLAEISDAYFTEHAEEQPS